MGEQINANHGFGTTSSEAQIAGEEMVGEVRKNWGDGGEVDVQHRLIVLFVFMVKKDEGGDKDETRIQ